MAFGSPALNSNPAIRVRSPSTHHSFASPTSFPMSIPGSSASKSPPPPPLPPPRYVEGFSDANDPAFHFNNSQADTSPGAHLNVKTGSSLLGGHGRSLSSSYAGPKKNIDFGMSNNETRASPSTDHAPSPGPDSARSDNHNNNNIPDLAALLEYNNKLQGENRLGQRSNASSSEAYDKQVLSRIGGPRTPPRSAGGPEDQQQQQQRQPQQQPPQQQQSGTPPSFKQLNGQLRPLTLPDRRPSETEHPRWTPNTGSASAFSPGLPSLQSPVSEFTVDRKQQQQHRSTGSFTGADGRSHPHSYASVMFGEPDHVVDDATPQDVSHHPRSPSGDDAKTGQKRRAQSPPSESIDPNLRGTSSSEWAQRQAPSSERHSQAARLQDGQAASLTSNVASAPSQSTSYASSYGMSNASTAATSYSSERPNSSNFSHAPSNMQPPSTPHSQQQQQLQQMPQPATPNGGQPQPMHARQMTSGMIRPPGVWICDCCPKKPKKFESEQDLRNHEAEKQYVCHYCHNRFKNKNEAERHQNSLHLRRHSWSCAALQTFENAFHATSNPTLATAAAAHAAATSTNPPAPYVATTDTCGYCGQEFANPPNWDERVEHLNHVHKFGECNQSKKFFRADHFRQHLKHSHAGTSGRWTNMLESACMREELPPQPIPQQMPMGGMPSPMQGQAPPAQMQGASQAAQMAQMLSPQQQQAQPPPPPPPQSHSQPQHLPQGQQATS